MDFDFISDKTAQFPVSKEEIKTFERRLNISFPPELREYYTKHNGCRFASRSLNMNGDNYRVDSILPLIHGTLSFEEAKNRLEGYDIIPRSFYPIANDDCEGAYYWDSALGGIWFTEGWDGSLPRRLFKDAKSFFDALNSVEKNLEYKGADIMEYKMYLPLGSVVLLRNGAHKLIIVGRGINVKQDNETYYFDYGAALYPEGLVSDELAYFNHDAVDRVFFEGYRDDDNEIMNDRLNDFVNSHADLKRADFKS